MNVYNTIYSLDKFSLDFKDVDFDNLLIEQNNVLVNSNQHYLELKKDYLQKTQENFTTLSNTLDAFYELVDNYKKHKQGNTTRHHYNVVNQNTIESLNIQIKTILDNQRTIFSIFINYINFINS